MISRPVRSRFGLNSLCSISVNLTGNYSFPL
nr:MAG TPA: hypothetical protein [Bacteriophage sp.]